MSVSVTSARLSVYCLQHDCVNAIPRRVLLRPFRYNADLSGIKCLFLHGTVKTLPHCLVASRVAALRTLRFLTLGTQPLLFSSRGATR